MYFFVFSMLFIVNVNPFLISSLLQSPCPRIFQYKTRNDFYQYGLLTVPSPPLDRPAVSLLATFSLRGRLPTQYGGLLELQRSRNETIQDILQQNPINFIINFPMQAPLPRLVFISFDNRVICGQSDYFMLRRQVLHKIEFRYTFNTSGLQVVNSIIGPTENHITELGFDNHFPARENHEKLEFTNQCGVLHDKFASTPLVAGGTSIQRGSWPWLVAIYTTKSSGPLFRCAGSLVSDKHVLTAASCFKEDDMRLEFLVTVGRYNLSNWLEQNTQTIPLLSIIKHPKHRTGSADYDIAMIILMENVSFNEFVQPVCLWTNIDDPTTIPMGLFGTVVGWGGGASSGQPLRMTPESVTIPVVAQSLCEVHDSSFDDTNQQINQSRFCAGNRNGMSWFDTCYGDLGSGFVTLREHWLALRGIVTNPSGEDNCKSEFLLMTDVAKHTDWLRQFM